MNKQPYFQGDVLILPVDSVPENLIHVERENGRVILAHGEVTGHAHAILDEKAELFSMPDTEDRFLRIMEGSGVNLQHEEHATITLPPGDYCVRIQQEYVPQALPRRVAD